MKLFLKINLLAFFILLLITCDSNTNENNNKSLYAKDHFIVKLKTMNIIAAGNFNASNDKLIIKNISKELGLTIKEITQLFPIDMTNKELYFKHEFDKYYLVFLINQNDIPAICKVFEYNKYVDFAEPDYIGEAAAQIGTEALFPNDEYFKRQWGLFNDGSMTTTKGKPGKPGGDMKVIEGWKYFSGSDKTIVAILDSGVKLSHPDLRYRFWVNKNEVLNGRDDDANGFIDDINGYNFAYDNADVTDDGGHGTNIAGTIASNSNNEIGYSGLDKNCKIMICKNLDSDNLGEYSWWSKSIYYAANNGADIINMSEGGYEYSRTLKAAVDYAYGSGALIVASMMNKNNNERYYPASFSNVLAVGATDTDDSRCKQFTWGGGSNWGKHIAVVAPGNKVYGLDYQDDFDYSVYWSGTSQATAYVSAVASVLLGQDPERTNIDLRKIITSTADDSVGDPREDKEGWDEYYGYGRVNLANALTYDKNIDINYIDRKNKKPADDINDVDDDDVDKAKAVKNGKQRIKEDPKKNETYDDEQAKPRK